MAHLSKYHFQGIGLEKEEKKPAKKLFADYRKNYTIDLLSDLQLLEELVYRETLQIRYKKKIEEIGLSKTVKNKNIPVEKYSTNWNLNHLVKREEVHFKMVKKYEWKYDCAK